MCHLVHLGALAGDLRPALALHLAWHLVLSPVPARVLLLSSRFGNFQEMRLVLL